MTVIIDSRTDRPGTITADAFKSVFRRHPAGVGVITLAQEGRLVGFTATSVISVSAEPPLLAFSIDSRSSSWPSLALTDSVAISFLAAEQVDVSARFATSGIDRFADGGWSHLETGEPVIDGAPAWIRGRVVQRTPVGSSYLVAVLATDSSHTAGAAPLVYHDRVYHQITDESAI
ncbi:MAG: flavin reductase family protein [Propionibacteriaceae bacterium]